MNVPCMSSVHTMPFGASLVEGGGVMFSLWAPSQHAVLLEHAALGDFVASKMQRDAQGWHRLHLNAARAGDSYRFRLPDGLAVPDPASRFNPGDVHAASQVIDPTAYAWQDGAWRGRPWHEAVVYELHLGSFTPEGTFAAAKRRLPYLAELGVTAIELMPVADFAGKRGWGYDGVLLFAPEAAYGTPNELKSLVDAAHGLALMVLLDVVYNHFGPEGNYLHAACPEFFNPAHQTPWGAAINYDGALSRPVRDFFIHNALYWVEEFHFDGLRMDAVHAIRDDSPLHIVREICTRLREGPGQERALHVVLENEDNGARLLARDGRGGAINGSAQWNDDLHHAAHVLITGQTDGYYTDFADAPLAQFGRALSEGFIYQGQASRFRSGATRGERCTDLPLSSFVSFLQSHDQIGNRPFGERLHQLGDPVLVRAALACVLLSPHVPMLFMGEEFAASTPFLYFCDFGPDLAKAVADGRRAEFGGLAAFTDEAARAAIPDPNAESTFVASRLLWEEIETQPHRQWLADVRALLTLRRTMLFPLLESSASQGTFSCDGDTLRLHWALAKTDGTATTQLHLLAHFGADDARGVAALPGHTVYAQGLGSEDDGQWRLARGAVVVTLQESSDG